MTSRVRWGIVAVVVLASLLYAASRPEWLGYVQSWGGKNFRALNGAILGWAVSRFVDMLDLSQLPAVQRPMAGISRAILIGLGMVALT